METKTQTEASIGSIRSDGRTHPLGSRYFGATLSKCITTTEENKKINKWLKEKNNFLLLIGNCGIGKTHLCAAIYNYAKKNKMFNSIRCWNERELLERVKADMQFGEYRQALELLIDDELVIVDDLGSGGYNEWGNRILFDMIDMRYSSKLPTIFSSNLNEHGLKEQLGERSSSRLFDVNNTILLMNGKDLRQEICPKS